MQQLRQRFYSLVLFALGIPLSIVGAHELPENITELFAARAQSVVVIEFFVQQEIDRVPHEAVALVVDQEGLVVLLDTAIPTWLPPEQFKDFRVFRHRGKSDGHEAEYLGYDFLNGWHYLRVAEAIRAELSPITEFDHATPTLGQSLWGIGILGKNFDFEAYFLSGRLSLVQKLPLEVGFSEQRLATPGGPIFDGAGRFVGWAGHPTTQERLLTIGAEQYRVGIRSLNESNTFLLADEFFANIGRVPLSPVGDPRPWIGIAGMQPVDREVARFLGLEEQGAVVLSSILEGSPAQKGGLMEKDIVIAAAGEALPKFRPEGVVQRYLERLVLSKKIGDRFPLTVMRGGQRQDLDVEVGMHPKPLNQANRHYFPTLGLTIREFVLWDAIGHRVPYMESKGVIASFVKPNSPVNTAGLMQGDWIKEIDGQEVTAYDQAVTLLAGIEADEQRDNFVLLIDRKNETSVLRVKLR